MKKILLVVFAFSMAYGQDYNNTGYRDTSLIAAFKADSLKYGAVRPLSQYENLVIDVWANDTSAAGYKDDSVAMAWGIQTGHCYRDANGTLCTLWARPKQFVDSFHISSSIMADTVVVTDSLGNYYTFKNVIDTTKTDFARQSVEIKPKWDVFFRTWFKGATGNDKLRFVSLRDLVVRRIALPVKGR